MVSKSPEVETKGYKCIDGIWFTQVGLAGRRPQPEKPLRLVEHGYECIDGEWYRKVEVCDA